MLHKRRRQDSRRSRHPSPVRVAAARSASNRPCSRRCRWAKAPRARRCWPRRCAMRSSPAARASARSCAWPWRGACGDDDPALADAAAAAIELLHCASLVHDDLPCFDDAATRRGVPSVHAAFGERIAVLAGDALIVLAFQALAAAASAAAAAPAGAADRAIARAASARPAASSPARPGNASRGSSLAAYHRAKTGSLFAACTEAGALAAGADPAPWRAFGLCLGEAYQVADDIRDVVASIAGAGQAGRPRRALRRPSSASELGLGGAIEHFDRLVARAIEAMPGLRRRGAAARPGARRIRAAGARRTRCATWRWRPRRLAAPRADRRRMHAARPPVGPQRGAARRRRRRAWLTALARPLVRLARPRAHQPRLPAPRRALLVHAADRAAPRARAVRPGGRLRLFAGAAGLRARCELFEIAGRRAADRGRSWPRVSSCRCRPRERLLDRGRGAGPGGAPQRRPLRPGRAGRAAGRQRGHHLHGRAPCRALCRPAATRWRCCAAQGAAPALSRYWAYATAEAPGALPPAEVDDYSALMSASQPLVAAGGAGRLPAARATAACSTWAAARAASSRPPAQRAPGLKLMLFDLPGGGGPAARDAFAAHRPGRPRPGPRRRLHARRAARRRRHRLAGARASTTTATSAR